MPLRYIYIVVVLANDRSTFTKPIMDFVLSTNQGAGVMKISDTEEGGGIDIPGI